MTGRRVQFGVSVFDGKIYVVGGRDGLKTLSTVSTFLSLFNMYLFICSIIGFFLSKVECWDPVAKAWNSMPPMATHRHGSIT